MGVKIKNKNNTLNKQIWESSPSN